jgi:pimeloyl-ACP methyl ester carboxylesterase
VTQCDHTPEVPAWFSHAVAQRPRQHVVEVDGAEIRYRRWGGSGAACLVLVHGAGAHSGWWDHVAPLLGAHLVVAVDLSGHGDSSPRDSYDMDLWAKEIRAVSADAGLHRPILVGHSMGGRAVLTTAVDYADDLAAAICVDTPLRRPRAAGVGLQGNGATRATRVYSTPEKAVAHFRTRPRQEALPAHVREHVARGSVRPVTGGWTWKGDQGVFGRGKPMQDLLPRVGCPIALLRGEHGLIPTGMAAEMSDLAIRSMPVIELPDTGHHPMLDQPLTLVTALRTLLTVWPPDGTLAGTDG